MKFIQIECHCQQKIFGSHILTAPHQESLEFVILFGYPEYTLCLDGSVYSKLNTFHGDNVLPAFFSELIECFTYLNCFCVYSFVAFPVVWTAFAGLALIHLDSADISGRSFLGSRVRICKFPPRFAGVCVLLLVVFHRQPEFHLSLEFLGLGIFVVGWLYVRGNVIPFQVVIVLIAFISGICDQIFKIPSVIAVQPVQKWYQRKDIASFCRDIYADYILAFYCDLHIVSGLQLTVTHMVFFHVHKGSIFVRFRVTVSAFEC